MRKKIITLFIFSLVLAWSLVGFSFSSLSIIFDDFDDSATDPTQWLTTVVGDGPLISEEQGSLEITLPPNSEDATAQNFFGAGYISICQLSGDFELQVDYLLTNWPSSNGVRVGLSLDSNYETPREYNVSRVSFGNMDFIGEPREVYLYGDGITETEHLSGKLRIKRVAALLTGYYTDGVNWVPLDTTPITEADLHFGVSAWSHSYAFANQNVKLAFDNLTILQGVVICPDESTPTPILAITPPVTPTAILTYTPTAIPEMALVYLPLVARQPTSTPTVTPTALPTHTPTATLTPTPTPTTVPRPVIEDGDYLAELGGGEEGWISFRVTGNGTKAVSGRFWINHQHHLCHPVGYVFSETTAITNGTFQFFADAASLNPIAEMKCGSVSSTRTSCTVSYFHEATGPHGFCGVAAGIASRH